MARRTTQPWGGVVLCPTVLRPIVGIAAAALVLALLHWPSSQVARANGAFPDSLGILLPADRPRQIFVSTTFGLLRSDDGGASFAYACEEAVGIGAMLYQLGPAPENRLYAVTSEGIASSSDDGCSWTRSESLRDPTDVFPDAHDAQRVLAIAASSASASSTTVAAFASSDAGNNFDAISEPSTAFLSGIEIARADPDVIYLSASNFDTRQWRPSLRRSDDGGRSWAEHDLSGELGTLTPYILSVDPSDVNRVYLRLRGSSGADQFGVYDDASATVAKTLLLGNPMTAFLYRSDAALIVGALNGDAFISMDRGSSFERWTNALHLRALAERDGRLYAAAFDPLDGFAVAVSDDRGESWQALLRFADITGPLQCGQLPEQCQMPWETLQMTLAGAPPIEPVFTIDAGTPVGPAAPASGDDGGCSATGRSPVSGLAWLALGPSVLCLLLRRRRTARA